MFLKRGENQEMSSYGLLCAYRNPQCVIGIL